MATYRPTVITEGGLQALAQATGGATITFTKIATTNTDLSDVDLSTLTALPGIKDEFSVNDVTTDPSGAITVSGALDNTNITEGYYIRGIGLYASTEAYGEVLYSVTEALNADWIPEYSAVTMTSFSVSLVTALTNSEDVRIVVEQGAYASASSVQQLSNNVSQLQTNVNRLNQPFQITVETTDWTLDNELQLYYYTYSATGCTSDDMYIVGLVTNSDPDIADEEKAEFNKLTSIETGTGVITMWANEEPEADLTLSFVYGGALNG